LVRLTYQEKLLLPISCRRPHRSHRVARSKLTLWYFWHFSDVPQCVNYCKSSWETLSLYFFY